MCRFLLKTSVHSGSQTWQAECLKRPRGIAHIDDSDSPIPVSRDSRGRQLERAAAPHAFSTSRKPSLSASIFNYASDILGR